LLSISVVIATYNRASLLPATIEQLRHQQYQPGDEVIIVDNGSTDATLDILSRTVSTFPVSFRVLHEPTRGKGPALTTGIGVAHGAVLALIDDDVLVAADWLATIRRIFTDPSVALVGGRVDPHWECPSPGWLVVQQQDHYGDMASPLALQHYGSARELGPRTAVGANLIVRRSVLEALGGIRPDLARRAGSLFGVEDQDLCRRARQAGYYCAYRPDVRVRHWVPAERLRLMYYLRWFFWSGYGNALLRTDDPIGPTGQPQSLSGHYLRRSIVASLWAIRHAIRGRMASAAETGVEAAYALGYVVQRTAKRLSRNKPVGTLCLIAVVTLIPPAGYAQSAGRLAPRSTSVRSLRHRAHDRWTVISNASAESPSMWTHTYHPAVRHGVSFART
jgi:glucosyl-dolichyl phosphate glucuronosyltransferase